MIGVMIVDDQAPVRMGLALMLRHDPEITVLLEAEDGKDALERLAHAEDIGAPLPDVVLMDVRMPRMDGIDATARITARWPDTHVLVLTTYDEDDYAFGGLSAGASGFLLKDVRSRDLCQAVCAVASGDAVLTPQGLGASRSGSGRPAGSWPTASRMRRLPGGSSSSRRASSAR